MLIFFRRQCHNPIGEVTQSIYMFDIFISKWHNPTCGIINSLSLAMQLQSNKKAQDVIFRGPTKLAQRHSYLSELGAQNHAVHHTAMKLYSQVPFLSMLLVQFVFELLPCLLNPDLVTWKLLSWGLLQCIWCNCKFAEGSFQWPKRPLLVC